MKFNCSNLDNGLTVIGETCESAESVAVGFFVRTGARDETPELSGVSHFLEHMMFKGTARRSALDLTYALGAIGAQANAYTSEETTVYYAYVLPEYLGDALDILSDMLRSTLDVTEFNTEKNVILEEIALYQDRPTYQLFEASLQQHFRNHSAGNPVLGTNESIKALTQPQMKAYFERRYVPANMVLVASGRFDYDSFFELASRHCGGWSSGFANRELVVHKPTRSETVMTKEGLHCAHLCYVTPGPSAVEECQYAAGVLSCILGDTSGSRMYWDLVDKGLAESAHIDVDCMDGTGIIYAYACSEPEKIDSVGDIVVNIMNTAKDFSDDDLERAKTKLATRLVVGGESARKRMMTVGNDWIYRKQYFTLQEELRKIQDVSRGDIEDVLSLYSFSPVTKVKLIPA
ncbi:MAG: insulinase family protein [Deltaproteobacteria bacterium]|nr:insulinase family protein [Deltaproteobacteria bacterium]